MRGVREKGSSGSGLSESRCSFLFRAFVPQTKDKKRADRQKERERETVDRDREEERERVG